MDNYRPSQSEKSSGYERPDPYTARNIACCGFALH